MQQHQHWSHMSPPSQVAWATGVNHVASGLASYTNIAPTDPIQQLGLSAWDNDEVGQKRIGGTAGCCPHLPALCLCGITGEINQEGRAVTIYSVNRLGNEL